MGSQSPSLLAVLLLCMYPLISTTESHEELVMQQVESVIRRSFQAEAEGRLQEALSVLQAPLFSGHPATEYRRGKVLLQLKRWNEALRAFKLACLVDHSLPGIFSHIAYVMRKVGSIDLAHRSLKAAMRMDRKDLWIAPQLLGLIEHGVVLNEAERSLLKGRTLPNRSIDNLASEKVAIVTAANSLYFGCVSNFVGSVHRHHPRVKIFLYDLGLNDMERENSFAWKNVELMGLQWDKLGAHVQNKRWKAWKPFVLSDALQRVENVIFQDAGQVVQQPIDLAWSLIQRDGYFFTIQQERALPNFVHPKMFGEMNISQESVKGYDMCAAGILGMSNSSIAVQNVLHPLVACASRRSCIAPEGASQSTHRFEQAALSILLAREQIRCHNSWRMYAYLEEDQFGQHEEVDVANGYMRETPLWVSKRCQPPLDILPALH
mmetsp:Transcript_17686/g.58214  ORF Transcript_17686/g.58214 Transcript_17686/m.58214 type:complete len:434 (-) Transcript_17686:263-1564(-)